MSFIDIRTSEILGTVHVEATIDSLRAQSRIVLKETFGHDAFLSISYKLSVDLVRRRSMPDRPLFQLDRMEDPS